MRLTLALFPVLLLTGCVAPRSTSATYGVDSAGNVSRQTRAAVNGSTDAGPQEILGIYIPFVGTGLAVKAGLEWDGTPGPIVIPVGAPPATYGASPCELPRAAGPCGITRTVMVPETYYETETRQVPKTRMVPRTVTEPAAPVPLPRAPNPCGQPEPVAAIDPCPNGCCRLQR